MQADIFTIRIYCTNYLYRLPYHNDINHFLRMQLFFNSYSILTRCIMRARFKRKLTTIFSANSAVRAYFARKIRAKIRLRRGARVITRAERNPVVIARPDSRTTPRWHSRLVVARRFVTFGPPRLEFRDSFSPLPPLAHSDGDTYRVRVGMT